MSVFGKAAVSYQLSAKAKQQQRQAVSFQLSAFESGLTGRSPDWEAQAGWRARRQSRASAEPPAVAGGDFGVGFGVAVLPRAQH